VSPVNGGETGLTAAEPDALKIRSEVEGHAKTLDL
jgi:hypothetical protein